MLMFRCCSLFRRWREALNACRCCRSTATSTATATSYTERGGRSAQVKMPADTAAAAWFDQRHAITSARMHIRTTWITALALHNQLRGRWSSHRATAAPCCFVPNMLCSCLASVYVSSLLFLPLARPWPPHRMFMCTHLPLCWILSTGAAVPIRAWHTVVGMVW